MGYKPEGYPSLSPYLMVKDGRALAAFARDVLGAEELLRVEDENGRLRHLALRIDDSVLMLGEAVGDWPALPAHLHIYVPDVDAAHARALAAGASNLQAPADAEDGDRRGGVLCGNGISWWFGQTLPR